MNESLTKDDPGTLVGSGFDSKSEGANLAMEEDGPSGVEAK
jgi:hypothetical protein